MFDEINVFRFWSLLYIYVSKTTYNNSFWFDTVNVTVSFALMKIESTVNAAQLDHFGT
jgi:hypothetical protein